MSEVNITYETLFEILRNEKNRDEMQELSPSFYKDTVIYLNKNKDMLNQAIAANSSDSDKEALLRQLKNIKTLIREIYERREKKVFNLALNKSRTSKESLEIDKLLPEEKELYDNCVSILDKSRNNVLKKMLEGTSEHFSVKQSTAPEKNNTPETSEPKSPPEVKEIKEDNDTEESGKDMIELKFNEFVPKFLGKELEVYGPYEADDTAELPVEVANILITKGKAKAM